MKGVVTGKEKVWRGDGEGIAGSGEPKNGQNGSTPTCPSNRSNWDHVTGQALTGFFPGDLSIKETAMTSSTWHGKGGP